MLSTSRHGFTISIQATSSRSVLSVVYGPKTSLRLTDIFRSCRASTPTLGQWPCQSIDVATGCFIPLHRSVLPPSKREFPVRGLNLIRLLTQNRIADFHTTLESLPLPADEISANPYIAHPVNLERWLMEGSYSKVWNAREEAPAEEYKFFVDSLMGTIRCVTGGCDVRLMLTGVNRNEIASCEESAYESLPLKDAATLLFFTSQSDLLRFAQQVCIRSELVTSSALNWIS